MAQGAARRRAGMTLAAATFAGIGAGMLAGVAPASAAPYPPPDQPATSTSATEVQAGDDVTICAEHYAPDADVAMTDDGKKVTTLHTDTSGHDCATVVWHSPQATAKPVPHSAAAGTSSASVGLSASRAVRVAAVRAPSGTVCHTVSNTGPNANGGAATTSVRVCVEPANRSDTTGSASGGGEVASGGHRAAQGDVVHGALAFTGTEIAAMVVAALAALGLGLVALAVARRRRA